MKKNKNIKHLDYITALTTLMRLKAHLSILTSWVVIFFSFMDIVYTTPLKEIYVSYHTVKKMNYACGKYVKSLEG